MKIVNLMQCLSKIVEMGWSRQESQESDTQKMVEPSRKSEYWIVAIALIMFFTSGKIYGRMFYFLNYTIQYFLDFQISEI